MILSLVALAALAAAGAIVVLRDPNPSTIAAFAAAVGIATAAAVARVAMWLDRRAMPGRRRPQARPARAIRRGLAVGGAIAILVFLRAIDGLTPLVAAFVVLPFAVAELVLSARATALR